MLNILRIDLTSKKIAVEPLNKEDQYKFLGGRGTNRWILLKEIKKGTRAFDPENKLLLGTGLLAGTSMPGACRIQIDTISPFNNGVGSGNGGGYFSPKLRFAGWDTVIIEGKAEKPVYIFIENQTVEIIDAERIWGKTTWDTEDALREEHGEGVSVLSIGPAGENLVKSAAIIIDKYRTAARCGMGAVMGSKNLKAIAVEGDGEVKASNEDRYKQIVSRLSRKFLGSEEVKALSRAGTPFMLELANQLSWSPVRNFQDNYDDPEKVKAIHYDNWKDIETESIDTCYGCPVDCGFLRKVTGGPYKGTVSANTEANAFWDFSFKLGIYDPAVVVKAQEICNRYGMDVDSVSGAISWAYECYEKEILTKDDTEGLELTWGNDRALMVLLEKTALRQGIGDLLAEGCKEASAKLGRGSEKYCVHVKGQDLKEPVRTVKGWALGVMVSPRAGTHTRGCPETEILGLSAEDGEKYYGVPTAGDPLSYDGKAKLVVHTEKIHALCDSLGLCNILSSWMGPIFPDIPEYAELCSAFFDREISPKELDETAERIVTLEKYFNQLHTGFSREDDYPPKRLMEEPVKSGPLKGENLPREKWDEMLDEYYELHGWDKQTGSIPDSRLEELGILLP